MKIKIIILSILFFITGTLSAFPYDFEVDDICYYITSITDHIVEVIGCESGKYVIVIPETVTYDGETYSVTSIGNYAFNDCTSLKELRIEDGESTLSLGYNSYTSSGGGEGLFYDCPLETLYIGRNLRYNTSPFYGYSPFYEITTLKSVTIGNSVTRIGEYAFYGCAGLTNITIGKSVTSIGENAFSGYSGLATIVVDSGNTKYHSRNNCNAIIEAATSTLILGCKNTIIPNRVLSIRDYAFMGCSGLTSITIPNSVTSIGNYVFKGCISLKELRIEDGESTLSLGYNRYDSAKDGGLFYDCPLETLYLGRNLEHDGIYEAGHYSPFYDKDLLKSVIIGNSVTNFGAHTFRDCNSLTDVIIGESVKFIGYDAFSGCSGLTSVTIPNSVTSIGDGAFHGCTGLSSVIIGNSVTQIYDYAFAGCTNLTRITSLNPIPPTCESNVFKNVNVVYAALIVPQQSVSSYQTASVWKFFWDITGLDSSGIEEAIADDSEEAEYYNLQGVKEENPERGFYIKRQGGKTTKVVL